ncbi:hypothetical protein MFIFM68171_08277 [Madurella fahalii]|uniref:Uncharacterized protein n=1 Tax=Madurella fahalii TaxID=1157608 RepID=A0ABQ0GJX4_9PEZI
MLTTGPATAFTAAMLLLPHAFIRPVIAAASAAQFRSQAEEAGVVAGAEEPDYTCSRTKPCALGDDTGVGACGAGPDFCGEKCTSQCGWKSECDPGWGLQWSNASTCPLNVCCSNFGFCGTTAEFCNGNVVSKPKCSSRSSDAKTIGYYEGWNGPYSCEDPTSTSTVDSTSVPPSSTSPVSPSSTSSGGVAMPSPIRDGMVSGCKEFYLVQADDGCWAIANAHNIALSDFYAWNPAVNNGGI